MLRSLLFWLKYWLIFPGCRSYFQRQSIRHLVVLAFGRIGLQDDQRYLVGMLAVEHRLQPIRALNLLRVGTPNIPAIDPGYINRMMAVLAIKLFERSGQSMTLWLQWEIALAVPETTLVRYMDHIQIIWPSPRPGATLNAADIFRHVYQHMQHSAEDVPHTGLIAHQRMIIRSMLIWRKITGALPIIPRQNICGYLPGSIQPWTGSAPAWYCREAPGRFWLVFHNYV